MRGAYIWLYKRDKIDIETCWTYWAFIKLKKLIVLNDYTFSLNFCSSNLIFKQIRFRFMSGLIVHIANFFEHFFGDKNKILIRFK